MNRIINRTEYRFFVPGKPASFRVKAAKEFKTRARRCAREFFEAPLEMDNLEIRLDHFHRKSVRSDMDNIAKALIDALNGLAYIDDKQIRLQISQRHDLRKVVTLHEHPLDVIKPLQEFDEYLFVRIREPARR